MVCDGASGRSNCDGLESRRGGRQEGRRWEGGQKEEEEGEEEMGKGGGGRGQERRTGTRTITCRPVIYDNPTSSYLGSHVVNSGFLTLVKSEETVVSE